LRWIDIDEFRNHNGIGLTAQDPAIWKSVADAAKKAILFRYTYLPYLFSLHFYASMYGGTVLRPVFYEYSNDTKTYDLGEQFLWGSSMLIIPVIKKGAKDVKAYLPQDDWYSLYDTKYGQIFKPGEQTFPAEKTSLIPVLVRGGSILPRQKPNVTTAATRNNPFELLIAPGAGIRTSDQAEGFLYWDDGESIVESFSTYNYYYWKFKYVTSDKNAMLTITLERNATNLEIPTLDTVEVFNLNYKPDFNSFKLNGQKVGSTPHPVWLFMLPSLSICHYHRLFFTVAVPFLKAFVSILC
ncbi:glycosyl hydrolase, family 31, partial [Oesophagostomum dentatum]